MAPTSYPFFTFVDLDFLRFIDDRILVNVVTVKPGQSINQSINQLYLNTVNGSASWFSDMPCDNYNL